ncbi:MAG TPA: transposase [Telluria sp.]
MSTTSDDYDSPWKDAVTRYFPEFMAFYFPVAHGEIDWGQPYVFLEQELAQVVRDAELGRRQVDKLVRVVRRGGIDEWVFVHIDVQGRFDKKFPERVYVYNYRIYDRYRRPVASLAVLADTSASWKPISFHYELFGCEVGIRFPVVKLNDYAGRLDELLVHENVFALVTAAHLLTQQTRGQLVKRSAAKGRLVRLLFERRWDRQRIVDLFNVIDWMMRLPASLQAQLMSDRPNALYLIV